MVQNLAVISDSYEKRKAFIQLVSEGKVPGHSTLDKFGANLAVTVAGGKADIWEEGGLYVYDADGTAPIQYLSTSDVGNNQPIAVFGLDIDGYEVVQIVTANGQNNVSLTTPLWRCYRAINIGTTDIVGKAYVHTDPVPSAGIPLTVNIRASIDGDSNQTLMALYTVPKGKVGFLYRGELGVALSGNVSSLSEYATLKYKSRRLGSVFTVKKLVTCMVGGGSAIYQDPRSFPDIVPGMTDIQLRVDSVTQDMGLWGAFDMLLIDEHLIPEKVLIDIGQPGY